MTSARRKLRVVHFTTTWLPQCETWLYNQLRFLPPEVENHVVCKKVDNPDQFPVTNIRSLQDFPQWRTGLHAFKKKFRLARPFSLHWPLLEEVIRDVQPDILHSHFGHLGWVNGPIARKYGVKHVVSFYGADIHYVPRSDPRWFERYKQMPDLVDEVLCEGPHMAESITQLGIPREKIKVQRLGVELTQFQFAPRSYDRARKLRFFIVGAFREKKGIPYALEALGRFQKISDNFEVTVIGDAYRAHEKPVKEKILQTIQDWGLQSKVTLLGFQPYDEVIQEAYQHDIFLSPSVTAEDGDVEGGAPVSIIEMAATGMPVVSTTHCDIPFVLSPDSAPYLVKERDSEALCQAIVSLLASGWEKLVVANRKFVERELDARKVGESLYEKYEQLARGGTSQLGAPSRSGNGKGLIRRLGAAS